MEKRITKDEVQALCEKAYAQIGEGDRIDKRQMLLVLEATQAMSDLICDEVVNPISEEKMTFVILAMRQVLAGLEKKFYIDATLATVLASFIGSREATPADEIKSVISDAMRAMRGEKE